MAKRIGEFRGRRLQDFRAWIYVIAANQVNQVIRQKLRDRKLLDALAERIAAKRTRRPRKALGGPAPGLADAR